MFGDPVLNDNGWAQAKLSHVATKIGSGATPKGGKESYISEGVTLIRSMNVHDGRFEYKNLAHITDIQAKQLENVEIEKDDVLFNITGASIARSCIVPDEILPARVNQHVSIIRCEGKHLNPIFANRMLLTDSYKKSIARFGEIGRGYTTGNYETAIRKSGCDFTANKFTAGVFVFCTAGKQI